MIKHWSYGAIASAVIAATTTVAHADTFTVQDLGKPANVRGAYAESINNQGLMLATGYFPEQVNIDLTKVPTSLLVNLGYTSAEEIESLTPEEYDYLIRNLANEQNNNQRAFRVGLNRGLLYDGQWQYNNFFASSEAGALPASVNNFLLEINNNNEAVGYGSAPYYPIDHTYTTADDETVTIQLYQRDFISRGIWFRNGTTTQINPPETSYLGGESAILDINDSGLAAGYASIGVSPEAQTLADKCNDPEQREASQTAMSCMWAAWYDISHARANPRPNIYSASPIRANRSIYDIRGYLWQLDASGQVISSTELGTLTDREADEDTRDFSSYALAVNNAGIAVGQSWTYYENDRTVGNRIRMPAIFIDGEALPVTEDKNWLWGAATDINDNNLAIGYLTETRAAALRNKGFVYDVDAGQLKELDGFFTGSSTVPMAINNNNVVVGTGEIEGTFSDTRRRAGFMVDLSADAPKFIDLNDAISCDSDYFIVEANDINDNGEIIATALISETYVDGDGNEQERTVARSVKLTPKDGELNDCSVEENKVERQGASLGWFHLAGLLALGVFITLGRKR